MQNNISTDEIKVDIPMSFEPYDEDREEILSSHAFKIFQYHKDWGLVQPHLYDPDILELLDKGMSEYVGDSPEGGLPPWDRANGIGSYAYAFSNIEQIFAWCSESSVTPVMERAIQYCRDWYRKKADWFRKQPQPDKDSFGWYQCYCADAELGPWQKALAEKVFPEYNWKICPVQTPNIFRVDTVLGLGSDGYGMVFDILTDVVCNFSIKDNIYN